VKGMLPKGRSAAACTGSSTCSAGTRTPSSATAQRAVALSQEISHGIKLARNNTFYARPPQDLERAVYLSKGTGKVSVNGRSLEEFFGRETGRMIVQQPFGAVQLEGKFDVDAHVEAAESPARPVQSAMASPAR